MEYQSSLKAEHFRSVEDSFKLTILEIRNSNERLEHSLQQIEHHYISKLDLREGECQRLEEERRESQIQIHELERKLSTRELELGS